MPSSFEITPLDASFGAVVTGLTLASLDDAGFDALYRAWLDHALLILPGQHLDRAQQIAFARRFGAPEFEIAPISNVRADGTVRPEDNTDAVIKVLKGNMGWHCDSTYMPVQAKGAVFTAHVTPDEGGETGWADMRAAYDALAPVMKERIAPLSAHHSLRYSQGKVGLGDYDGYGMAETEAPLRPLVKTHPETHRRCLMVGRHAHAIPGLTDAESERLLDELADFAVQPPRVHHHRWTPGDAVVWDNRALMHRACPWDMARPRVMYHSRIAGDPVSEGWQAA
ncbi:MAG TPA: TauD/TfdA family dioxygenase, partial [Caulobacteraceae bacterium]|nr:TauD/TfdA family dioxygenase [Caulobacteraceae bacterium]